MSAAPEVINPQQAMTLMTSDCIKGSLPARLILADLSFSGDEANTTKVRKPYTITKQRERWTEDEHQKFLEALKLYGRAWRRIEEHIGTKTAVQIRSHAQKFFSKLERGASTAGKVEDIDIPPPRPKRKPSRPYPRKAGHVQSSSEQLKRDAAPNCSDSQPTPSESTTCTPYTIKGGSQSSAAAFPKIPMTASDKFFGPHGSVKLFGKTVVLPAPRKLTVQKDSTKEHVNKGRPTSPPVMAYKPTSNKNSRIKENPQHVSGDSDRNDLGSANNIFEVTGDSGEEISTDGLGDVDDTSAADSPATTENKTMSQKSNSSTGQVENEEPNTFAEKPTSHGNVDLHLSHQNSQMLIWLDSLFRYYSGLLTQQHGAPDSAEGATNPMMFPNFIQASAMNYPLHSATMAAVAAAAVNWRGPSLAKPASQTNANETLVVPSSGEIFTCTPLMPVATPWWILGGTASTGIPTSVRPADNDPNVNKEHHIEINECKSKGNMDAAKPNESTDISSICVNPSLTENTNCKNDVSNLRSAPSVDNLINPQGSWLVQDQAQHSRCSSTDDYDDEEGEKRSRDGSSSGSNTPVISFQISECDTPRMTENKKQESGMSFEKTESDHELRMAIEGCPKIRFKHIEKRKKNQQKDSRQGNSKDSKRLKSCPHDADSWKEVSEEGRRAFKALFSSKDLPQTFPTYLQEAIDATIVNPPISKPIVSKNDSSAWIDHDAVKFSNYSRSSSPCTSSPESVLVNNVSVRNKSETLCATDLQIDGKEVKFSVSSRSGFVPYQRPSCSEAKSNA